MLIYIDDVILIGFSKRLLSSLQWEILSLYQYSHVVYNVKKLVRPCLAAPVLGLFFDGRLLTYGLSLSDKFSLSSKLRALAARQCVSPVEVSSLVGDFRRLFAARPFFCMGLLFFCT